MNTARTACRGTGRRGMLPETTTAVRYRHGRSLLRHVPGVLPVLPDGAQRERQPAAALRGTAACPLDADVRVRRSALGHAPPASRLWLRLRVGGSLLRGTEPAGHL